MASWALAELRVGRLQLHTDPENVAYNRRGDGTRADAVVYSLLPADLARHSASRRD
jgi:hypothetical protein